MHQAESVFIVGAGGHGKSIVGVMQASGIKVSVILVDLPECWGKPVLGVDVIGPIDETIADAGRLGILGIGDNNNRMALAERLSVPEWFTLIYPGAYVNPSAKIGPGTVVFPGAVIGGDVVIGKHAIVSANCTIGHDTTIGDYAQLAPGVQVAGSVTVGEGAMLGIGCCVVPKVSIGEWAVVGAGGTVVRNVAPRSLVLGVAAKAR